MLGNYDLWSIDKLEKLQNYLVKAEIEFVASTGGDFIEGLGGGEPENLKQFLEVLGFEIIEESTELLELGKTITWFKSNNYSFSSDGFVYKR